MTTTITRAIAQTRFVFEGDTGAQDALEYLEQVLAADQEAAALTDLQRAVDESRTRMETGASPSTAGGPAPADVMALILVELRGLRADMDADRFAARAAVVLS